MNSAFAIAYSNIALAKYWGKLDRPGNYPAVPSLSMTVHPMATHTRVSFDQRLSQDEMYLEGEAQSGRPLQRAADLLDQIRKEADTRLFARVDTRNNFPTAAGLASSASGFAALALAARAAVGLPQDINATSSLARRSSASAARSLYGRFVTLECGQDSAARLEAPSSFDLRMLVAVTAPGAKSVASTNGMVHTRLTSPYYQGWLDSAPALYEQIKTAVVAGDFNTLGPLIEQSALLMHASMLAAAPAIIYWNGGTLNVIETVRRLRARGVGAYFTMDAGPHVKVITLPEYQAELESALEQTEGVRRVIRCTLGPDASVET